MKRSFSFLAGNKVFLCFLLAGFFMLAGINNTTAQTTASNGANPHIDIAQKFGVTAYPLSTFDQAEAIAVLQQLIAPLEPIIINGGGSNVQKTSYAYYTAALNDINKYSIAPEISLLKRMGAIHSGELKANLTNHQQLLKNLYNQIVSELL